MATRLATVGGYALRPGVSRNGRLYTPEVIQKAVERAQTRISNGGLDISRPVEPMSQRTHHAADDDSTRIVGRLTSMSLTDDGSARFTADIADTAHGRDIAALVSPKTPGDPASVDPFLRGVSIRGFWLGPVRRETGPDGALVETGDDLEIDGLDYTGMPGVPGAEIDHYSTTSPVRGVPREAVYSTESNPGRVAIYESVEARVDPAVEEKGAPALKSGKPAAAPTPGAGSYADPGYQDDRAKRYPLDTKAHAKAAWSYVNQAKNAKQYTAPQLKRIKGRIKAALAKFGVKITGEHWLVDPVIQLTETGEVDEYYPDSVTAGSFSISLSNGPVNVCVSSYQVDPADLDLIGRAAMDGACKALAAIDPDMDGDMDVPGADSEDTDNSMAGETDTTELQFDRMLAEADPGPLLDSGDPVGSAGVSDPPPAPDVPAADPTPQEEPAMADEPTPAVDPAAPTEPAPTTAPVEPAAPADPTPAAPAASGGVTMSDAQFAAMLSALRVPVAANAESAPTPAASVAAPVAAPAPVATETTEQMIARLVSEGVQAALPLAVQEHVQLAGVPGRKGLVVRRAAANETEATTAPSVDGLNEYGVPADWPNKPLNKYSPEERRKYFGPTLRSHYIGDNAAS